MEKREIFESSEELCCGLAEYLYEISESAIKEFGYFSLVISGGEHILNCLSKLSKGPYLKMVDWSKWYVFWAEENVVPKIHPHSLYKQAYDAFISKVSIPSSHIISVRHGVSGESAATRYEFSIRQHVRDRKVQVSLSSDCPRFDLVLLNMEPNGHVTSFCHPNPNHSILEEDSQWVACVPSSKDRIESVALTLPVINAAANVVIVASRPELARSLDKARMVWPKDGKLAWFVEAPTW
ncbi:hypothetical protein ACFE04_025435 [Oxalis oulophora]